MPKARAGQAARKKQERERAALEHREEIAAHAASHAPAPPEGSTPVDVEDQPAMTEADRTRMRPASGIASGPDGGTTVLADLTEVVIPDIPADEPAGQEPAIDVSPATPSVNSPVLSGRTDTEPRFAPVPQAATKEHHTMTDDTPSPTAPRGRMTDRYTVWSRAARGPIDTPADAPAGASVDSTERTVGAVATDAGARPRAQTVPTASAGYDLAVTRLQRATASTAVSEAGESLTRPRDDAPDPLAEGAITTGAAGSTEDGQTGLVDDARTTLRNATDRATETASAGTDQVRGAAAIVGSDVGDAGRDIATAVSVGAGIARDEIADAAGDVADSARTAGQDLAGVAGERRDEAEDRIEETVDQIVGTGRDAAGEIAGTVSRAAAEVRDDLAGAAHDLIGTGRETVGDARRIASDAVAGARSGVADAASSIGGTAQDTAGLVGERVRQTTRSVGQTVSGTAGSVAGMSRNAGTRGETSTSPESATAPGIGQSTATGQSADQTGQRRDYSRLVISAVAISISSGFTRWAVRRLTGADIALLGPARIRPGILGPGIAALIASLYVPDDDGSRH